MSKNYLLDKIIKTLDFCSKDITITDWEDELPDSFYDKIARTERKLHIKIQIFTGAFKTVLVINSLPIAIKIPSYEGVNSLAIEEDFIAELARENPQFLRFFLPVNFYMERKGVKYYLQSKITYAEYDIENTGKEEKTLINTNYYDNLPFSYHWMLEAYNSYGENICNDFFNFLIKEGNAHGYIDQMLQDMHRLNYGYDSYFNPVIFDYSGDSTYFE